MTSVMSSKINWREERTSKIVIPDDSPQELKDLIARANESETKSDEDDAKALSTRQRLMRHLNRETTLFMLSDDPEDYVELHLISPAEQQWVRELIGQFQNVIDEARRITVNLAKAKSKKKRAELKKQGDKLGEDAERLLDYQLHLVAALCVDPELDFNYWKSGSGFMGQMASTLIGHVLRSSREAAVTRIRDARFFRGNESG